MTKPTQVMANLHTAPFQCNVSGYPRIILHSRAMHGILCDATDVFVQVPRRGAETGGVLLGRREPNAIVIEDFVPVPSEHRFGRLYRLSELDRTRLREACQSAARQPRGLEPVGLYRSNAREESGATDEDAEYLADHLAEDRRVLLVVSPGVANPSFAGIFLWKDGRFEEVLGPALFPFEEVPVDSVAPPTIESPLVVVPVELRNAETTELPVPVTLPEPPPREEPRVMARPFADRTLEPEPAPIATKPRDLTRPFPMPAVPPPSDTPVGPPRGDVPPAEPHTPQLLAPSAAPRRSNKLVWSLVAAVVLAAITVGYLARQQPPTLEMTVAVPAASVAPEPSLPPTPAVERGETPVPPPPAAPAPDAESRDRQESRRQPAAEVHALLDRWAQAIRRGRIDAALSFYAPFARNEARTRILAMLGTAPRMDVFRLSEIAVEFPAPDQAVATLRENWQSGLVAKTVGEQGVRLTLRAYRDGWQIVSDQVEQVHWVQKIP